MKRAIFIGTSAGFMLLGHVWGQTLPTTVPSTQAVTMTATAPASREAIEILKLLENRDTTLRDFTGGVRYTAYKSRSEEEEVRTGTVEYRKDGPVTKFAITLDKFLMEEVPPKKIDQVIVFEGRWLIFRDADKHIFRKTELAPAGEQINPLKLGSGPLPLPIGQKTEEILRDFTVEVIPPNPKLDPKTLSGEGGGGGGAVHLRLTPHDPKRFGFKQADLWVDRKLELTIRASRVKLDDNVDTVDILHPEVNTGKAAIKAPDTPSANSGWDIAVESYESGDKGKPTTRP